MAKRKSLNKRLSNRNRFSTGSGFLDSNSDVLGKEETFWWNNLTNNTNLHLAKNSFINETNKFLSPDSQMGLDETAEEWWKVLESSDSDNFLKAKVQQPVTDTASKTTKPIISDSDEQESPSPVVQKKIIKIRTKPMKSKGNAFLDALDDTKNSETPEVAQKDLITKSTNDLLINNKSLQASNVTEINTSKKMSTSIDESHTTNKILKQKPQIFRRRYKEMKENAFENLLKSDEDARNKTEEMMDEPSFSNSIVTKSILEDADKGNVSNKSMKEHSIRSSLKKYPRQSIMNSSFSKLIPRNRSDSSFSFSDDNDENEPNHPHESLQKEISVLEKSTNEINDPLAKSKKTANYNKSETSAGSIRLALSETSVHSKMSKSLSKRSIDSLQQENINEENAMNKTDHEDNKSLTSSKIETIETERSMTQSQLKRRKMSSKNDSTNIMALSQPNNNTTNKSVHNSMVLNNDVSTVNETNVTKKQIYTINSRSNAVLDEDANEEASEEINEKLKTRFFTSLHKETSDHSISKSKEESFSKDNTNTSPKQLNINASSSKEQSIRATDIVVNDNDQNDRKTINASNVTGHQKKINEYFSVTSPKASCSKATQSQSEVKRLNKIFNDKEIKAKFAKKKKLIAKGIDVNLSRIQGGTQLKSKDIIEKIKKLQKTEPKKQPAKVKINTAYVVNGKVYKRPRLPRPQPWVTDRLYRYLWKKMEPKYKLLTRVHSEKFVQKLSATVLAITKAKKYNNYETQLNDLMNEMAYLGIIRTRNEFYDYCYEFLPYSFRVKVVPMITPGNIRNIPYDPDKLHEPLLED